MESKTHYQRNKSKVLAKNSEWSSVNFLKIRKIKKNYRRMVKEEVIKAYGGKCKCCGERNWEFLTIDHINGGGGKHGAERGNQTYFDLRKLGFPKDEYQLLCFNCNCSIGLFGYCPHRPKYKRVVLTRKQEAPVCLT